MSKVVVPRGSIWMREAFERTTDALIEKARSQNAIQNVTDPWYNFYQLEAVDNLQHALLSEDLVASYATDKDFIEVPRTYWRKSIADTVIRKGQITDEETQIEEDVFIKIAPLEAFIKNISNTNPNHTTADNSGVDIKSSYVSPFILLMIEAIQHHDISETEAPSIQQLQSWFLGRILPDGSRVSPNQAKYLASFSRPPQLMKGGNFKKDSQKKKIDKG